LAHLTPKRANGGEIVASFSKNRNQGEVSSLNNLSYETIYRIARMRIVDENTPLDISIKLKIKYIYVQRIIDAKKQHNLWLDAIATLGREGLIHD
jgi:hypothetical protein